LNLPFHSLYRHGFARVAVAVPHVRVADPKYNAERTLEMARQSAKHHAVLTLFPELGISAYSCEDLFQQDALLDAVLESLEWLRRESADLNTILLVGAPLRTENKIFNCGIAIYKGEILGVTPKSYLPNYREVLRKASVRARPGRAKRLDFSRQFRSAISNTTRASRAEPAELRVFDGICEDVWTPLPPSTSPHSRARRLYAIYRHRTSRLEKPIIAKVCAPIKAAKRCRLICIRCR
jgi:NAD+ synthase (glutamine-hydrolysing)